MHSSTAEYKTFVATAGDSEIAVGMGYENENIWLMHKLIAELYGVSAAAINQHIKQIFADKKLQEDAVINYYT